MFNWHILRNDEEESGEPIDIEYFLDGLALLSKGTLGDPDKRLIYNVVVSGDTIRVRIFDNDKYFGDEYKAIITMDGDRSEYKVETTGIFNHPGFEPYGGLYSDLAWRINRICDGRYLPEFEWTVFEKGVDLHWFIAHELDAVKKSMYYLKYDDINNYHLRVLAPIMSLSQWEHNEERKYFYIELDPER